MSYLRFLTEGQAPNMFYHASPTQGLNFLDPRKTTSTHLANSKPYVYVTDDPTYAAGFSFEWSNNEGFRFGSNSEDFGDWFIEIPSKYKSRLSAPCSMYHIRNQGFRKVYGAGTPEWYSKSRVAIFKEEKFRRAIDCMNKYNVQIKFR